MGLFKGMKDMKDAVAAAPGLIDQAQKMAADAQKMSAGMTAPNTADYAQAMAHQQAAAGTADTSKSDLSPIADVSIELYAQILKGIADKGYDESLLPGIAATKGLDADAWATAHEGWNARITADPVVARRFSDIYTAA